MRRNENKKINKQPLTNHNEKKSLNLYITIYKRNGKQNHYYSRINYCTN